MPIAGVIGRMVYQRNNNVKRVGQAFNPTELFSKYSVFRRDRTIRVIKVPGLCS